MSLGWNSAQFGNKPGCTDTEDGKRRDFPTIFVALISCAVTAPDVTSKVWDHVKFDEESPFFLVNLCQHQN